MLYSCTCMQALDMIRGKNILLLMDSHLEGNFSTEEATVLVGLASQCLQYEPRERPNLKNLVATLVPLNTKPEVSKLFQFSYSLASVLYDVTSSDTSEHNVSMLRKDE